MPRKTYWWSKILLIAASIFLIFGALILFGNEVFAVPRGAVILLSQDEPVIGAPRSPIFIFGDVPPAVCPVMPSGAVSHWPGNGDALDAVDGNDGNLTAGVTYAPGKVGQAFSFSGTGLVSVPDATNLDVQSGFTFEAWVNSSELVPGANIINRSGGAFGVGYGILTKPLTGDVYRCQIDCGDNCDSNVFSTTPIAVGAFQHVACTFDGSTMKLYVNGVMEGSSSVASPSPNVTELNIGAGGFKGLIDGVGIYNRALSDAEILALHNDAAACVCSDGVRNGDETDIDCGGSCSLCGIAKQCLLNSDCASDNCVGGVCAEACVPTSGEEVVEMSCEDGIDNDCNGLTDASDADCSVSAAGELSDAESAPVVTLTITENIPAGSTVTTRAGDIAAPISYNFLASAHDDDSGSVEVTLVVGDLESVGSGAGTALVCNDGQINGDETDVDCGGPTCSKCLVGRACAIDSDCGSNSCVGDICQSSLACLSGDANASNTITCTDLSLIQDIVAGLEDGTAFPCADQNDDGFYTSDDTQAVQSAIAGAGLSCGVAPSCIDGLQNQDETGVDCGGSTCPACPVAPGILFVPPVPFLP